MIQRPNFLIISGNGRNTGKTSFVCELIRKTSKIYPVTAIKVSPHHHDRQTQIAVHEGAGFGIWEEQREDGIKDSSRMLLSGAGKVYYIEAKDDSLANALDQLLPMIDPTHAVVCESGGMRTLIEPSILILLNEEGRDEKKQSYIDLLPLANACITFKGDKFDPDPKIVDFDGMKWILDTGY